MRSWTMALAAALALAAAAPLAGAPAGRVVSVVGRGAAAFTPGYVSIEFSVLSRAPAYAEAQSANLSAVEAALAVVTGRFGVAKADVATLGYRLSEEVEYEEGKQRRSGYSATTRMSARLRDIGAYRALVTALLDAGVNAVDSISFGADDLAALREKALAAAYADAERKAAAIALASGSRLGPLLSFSEMGGPEPAPQFRAKLALRADAVGNGEVLSSGEQVVEAQAYAEFALK